MQSGGNGATPDRCCQQSGIGMTMLPVLYSYADFNAKPLRDDQRRFATSVDDILLLVQNLEASRSHQVEVGVAPHSLRAASIGQIRELQQALPAGRPVHIHIAEQIKEVEACLAASGQRPVELLLDSGLVDQRWCLVHATHLTPTEVAGIAASGAVAGICPSTEANLGDGFFDLPDYIAAGGRFGIGSDSHVSQSVVEELRWLEYGQRLRLQGRNIAGNAQQKRSAIFCGNQRCKAARKPAGAGWANSLPVIVPTSSCWMMRIRIWPEFPAAMS
jgi:formimidoylglutamate deiminase